MIADAARRVADMREERGFDGTPALRQLFRLSLPFFDVYAEASYAIMLLTRHCLLRCALCT